MNRTLSFLPLIFAMIIICAGCNMYKVVTRKNVSSSKIVRLSQKDKYFIIHYEDSAWHLDKQIVWNNELQGYKTKLDDWHKNYLNPHKERNNKFSRKDGSGKKVVDEIHIYTSAINPVDDNRVSIPLDSIHYYEIYKHQNGELAGGILGSILIGGIILFSIGAAKYW